MREIQIDTRKFGEKFKEGLESILYYYNDSNYYDNEVLYKRFRAVQYISNFNKDVSSDMFENKYEKILIIPTLKCFKDEVKILDIGIENNKHLGYTMKKSSLNPIHSRYEIYKNENDELINKLVYYGPNRKVLSTSDKIKYLKLMKEKIEKFNDSEVYIGDFNYENFLVSNDLDQMKLCDLDNLKMWSHDFDNKTASVKRYEEKCMTDDYRGKNIEGLDSFCFNIFTLALLSNESNFTILRDLENIELPEILKEYPNEEILESVKHLDKTYKPRYFIDIFN